MQPEVVLLFSGKRKSGKDYITDHLKKLLGDKCEVLKISRPVKSFWAKEKKLNLNELMSDGDYKEQYRNEMVIWSDNMRAQDYGYFCKEECQNAEKKSIWIVSDVRRKSDIKWFTETYNDIIKTIRINANSSTREKRGFKYIEGIDDKMTECDLDDFDNWDLVINNDENNCLEGQLAAIIKLLDHL